MSNVKSVSSKRVGGEVLQVEVRHDPRASYGRSVLPAATRYIRRVFPFEAWELTRADLDRPLEADGLAVTVYTYDRNRSRERVI